MPSSPLQIVKSKFEGRAGLVDKLADMVDDLNDDGKDGVKSRLMGLSNKKLLRLYKIEQAVRERYGDRDKLTQKILDARRDAGVTFDADYKAKLAGYSKGRLLDLARQSWGTAATKWTAAQKLASKRGKKARARAIAKIG